MDTLLDITIFVHRSAAIASFVMLPVNWFTRKGSPFHVQYGKILTSWPLRCSPAPG